MMFRAHNNIRFLPSGSASYAVRWALLEQARSSIHLVTFSFMKDETTKKLFALLKQKAQAGVKVRIIYDEIVNRTTFIIPLIKDLHQYGIETYGYNSLKDNWNINFKKGHPFKQLMLNVKLKLKQHFHEKYFIVDNKHLVIGGINWGDKYAYGGIQPKAWRDTDVYITGEVVQDVQDQFLSDFEMQKTWQILKHTKIQYAAFAHQYQTIYKDISLRRHQYPECFDPIPLLHPEQRSIPIAYMAHKPYDENELKLTNYLLEKIKAAQKRIYWGCHGIRPPRIFAEYFKDAVDRGVEIKLITNSKKSSRTLMVNGLMGWMYWECTKHYKYLLEHGIEIYEWQKPGAFHSKNLIIDDDFVSIGSFNIANGSSFHHSESNIVIQDQAFCQEVYEQFLTDLKDCKQIDPNTFNYPKVNAFDRILHERNKMIRPDLLTPSIRQDLAEGKFKDFPLYEFIDIS
ncbi:phospholipase D-like domain-containing protein [Edaphocola flava]|uniref:phospholipase D-like domain-containing protein n=1 Tax=Edaphocola flava TaxID=2499629 RepID=UPI00100A7D73|nr:phosphatidylserine/phosphatidylglycerophosphate/cardiolipin synthase family protein [Edaphocola flava]